MRRCVLLLSAFCLSFAAMGQTDRVDEDAFRIRMEALVSEGNRQYERSNRAGIQAAADELENSLAARRSAGLLREEDDLEFTADLYKLRGDWHYENSNYEDQSYEDAEKFFLKALAVYEAEGSVFTYDLDKIPAIHRELAQLYYKWVRYEDACDHISRALSAFDEGAYNLFFPGDALYEVWLDLRMQKAICLARLGKTDEASRMADELIGQFEKGSEKYYESLRKKAKILMLSGIQGREKRALPLYKAFYDWRKQDALSVLKEMTPAERQDYWMRMRPFVTDCFQLEGEDPGFIFDVALFSKGLLLQLNAFDRDPEAIKSLEYGWQDVQRALPADGCAIEFVQYEKDGCARLGAVVVRKKGTPVWVNLLSPADFLSYEIDGKKVENRLYSTSGSLKNALYQDDDLKGMIWSLALVEAIRDCGKVYFSPDGYIHQLAVEYLLPESLNAKKFYRVSSSRQLLSGRKPQLASALIIGGLRYLTEVPTVPEGNDSLAYKYLNDAQAYFSNLSGTRDEAGQILAARACPEDSLLLGIDASEPVVRSLMGQYSIVNISTHGFFDAAEIPQGTDLKPCMADETLSQSSVALSGANRSLLNFSFDTRYQDGILSAAEIASLDLSKVDLAVVSACQTALGRVTGDGVYGIQRGLKNAGAGAMVVSLWSVNDKATAVLMARFHRNLAGGMDIHDAFFAARQSLMDETEDELSSMKVRKFNPRTMSVQYLTRKEEFCEPQYYDAFILIDAL